MALGFIAIDHRVYNHCLLMCYMVASVIVRLVSGTAVRFGHLCRHYVPVN